MDQFTNLLLDSENGILVITVNRPDKLNALNVETIRELEKAFENVYDDRDIRGVIITGAGEKAFVAGADIEEISQLNELNARKFAEKGQEILKSIENCNKPVIAAVNGFALGGGCELSMACHIRMASEKARFGQPEVNLGIIPGYGGTQRLTHLVGKGKALELMITGEIISAREAYRLGLVNHIVEDGKDLLEESKKLMSIILSKAPYAVGMVIECVNIAITNSDKGFQPEANSFAGCTKTNDFHEGTRAFLEKRPAKFSGN